MPNNTIFLGCNYSNKKVKEHFNMLKTKFEEEYPVSVVLIDKVTGAGTQDLWEQIKEAIEESSLAIFDVSAFKPNVVLELGYALAIKEQRHILITFDTRRNRDGKSDEWKLSDIGHLHWCGYKRLSTLDDHIEQNLQIVPVINNLNLLYEQAERDTNIPDKYYRVALKILQALKAGKRLGDRGIQEISKGTNVRFDKLSQLLKRNDLASRGQGRYGKWRLCD